MVIFQEKHRKKPAGEILIDDARVIKGTHQRADGKPPQGNQQLLVEKDKVGRPPGEFGVSKSIGCDTFPSVL